MQIGAHNLARLAEAAYERDGDYESLFFEGRWYRSGELRQRAVRLGQGFVELGVEPGDRVVVMMANCPEVGLTYHALWRAGAVITPAIFLLPPEGLRHILVDAEPRAIVTTPEFLGTVATAAADVPSVKWIVSTGDGADDVLPLSTLEAGDSGSIVPRADDDLAALLYTGGTTGRAKGVMLSHDNLWSCAKSSNDASFVPGVNRTLVPLPLAHAFGLAVTVTGMHVPERGRSVLMRWFEPQAFLSLAASHGMQRATVVPSMLQLLLAEPLEEHDLSALRYVSCGASPLPRDVLEEFERRVPNVRILEGYGCTESGGVISVNRPGGRRVGTVGRALPEYEVRIEPEGEDPQVGEVCCRAQGVMQGYWGAPEATAEALRDGWLRTGDIGRLDEDGFITILDRKKDLIIRGGFNVFPRDVEDTLVEHPAVGMAGVVGRPDPTYGEEVVAFVMLQPGVTATPEELVDWAKVRLGSYKYPREVRLLDALPLTPVGKIDRKRLRAMV